jgi:hypothetical protein
LNNTLNELWLQGNDFTGTIPPEIGLLTRLAFMQLDRNELIGSLPRDMSEISIQENDSSGTLMTEIDTMKKPGFHENLLESIRQGPFLQN